jgi:L-alanine-DL-glutamate epimerase-like enolase superfamily enzyme
LAKSIIDQGFGGIKMKVGLNPTEDIERVKAIRSAIGKTAVIDIDVNGAYTPKDAIYMLKRVADCMPCIVEQPVNRDDLSGMALVRKSVDIPIGACESALTLAQVMRVIQMEAADFFNYKISRSGGLFPAKQAVRMIEAAGLFVVGSEQLGFGVEVSAQAHFAVATPTLKWPAGYAAGLMGMAGRFDTIGFEGDITDNTPVVKNGHLQAPRGPGLGVNLVEDKWKRYLTPDKEIVKLGRTS